jgi:uncharacterized protein (UPF0212 family)
MTTLVESRCPTCGGPLVQPTFLAGNAGLVCGLCAAVPSLDAAADEL